MPDKLIFLDTESTGNDPKNDRLCQISYKVSGEEMKSGYFKPPVPISVKAMSITHITSKMVESREAFADSEMKKDLQELLKDHVLVAHNALFDIAMLKHEAVEVPRFICTLRLSRDLDKENKIPEYGLQFLRYFLDLEVEADAHDATGDVLVLEALFERLYTKLPDVEKMVEISSRPTLFKNLIFGKYKGKEIAEIVRTDRRYLEWLLSQKTDNETDEDWVFTLKHYLGL
ncbi:MAG TPA: exonuclease domain-containing protein [Candidatus Paceibacterota bacterium]